ncbi:MAG: hypothetical protein WCH75_25940, partial [Candidatus Binatia bacterium]
EYHEEHPANHGDGANLSIMGSFRIAPALNWLIQYRAFGIKLLRFLDVSYCGSSYRVNLEKVLFICNQTMLLSDLERHSILKSWNQRGPVSLP